MNWLGRFFKKHWPYPTALLGFVWGPVRWETMGGYDVYVPSRIKCLLFQGPLKSVTPDGVRTFAVTHLQKKSRFGFLIQWPLCFHIWFTFQFQTPGVPGSERVFYWRAGLARWDAGAGRYYSPTWYGPGLHWD